MAMQPAPQLARVVQLAPLDSGVPCDRCFRTVREGRIRHSTVRESTEYDCSELAGGVSMPGNPFTYGNPISDPGRFYGRAREVEQIFGRLRNEESESSSLVGDRRIGKTSLMNYLADSSVRATHGLPPEQYVFVYADLQMVDAAMGPVQLWHRLLKLMRQHCRDKDVAELLTTLEHDEQLDTFALDELFEQVDDKGQYIILLLD